jgi:hypothetical protein
MLNCAPPALNLLNELSRYIRCVRKVSGTILPLMLTISVFGIFESSLRAFFLLSFGLFVVILLVFAQATVWLAVS